MRHGDIVCTCGQEFYFETVNLSIRCIKCEALHDVSEFPILETVQLEAEEDGTDI